MLEKSFESDVTDVVHELVERGGQAFIDDAGHIRWASIEPWEDVDEADERTNLALHEKCVPKPVRAQVMRYSPAQRYRDVSRVDAFER